MKLSRHRTNQYRAASNIESYVVARTSNLPALLCVAGRWPRGDTDQMEVIAQSDRPNMCGGLDDTSSQTKSYDTIGTIPCVGANTAAAIPGETSQAYVVRSMVEVRRRGSSLGFSLGFPFGGLGR